jgi:DNA-binding HxlR family transcriptional regulator
MTTKIRVKPSKFLCHAAVQTTLSVIGGKWKPLILWHLLERKMRFGELQKSLDGISQKILANELKTLEKFGIVHRKLFHQVPPKVEYWITSYGLTLRPILEKLADWGGRHRPKIFKK